MDHIKDALLILAVVVVNALAGFIREDLAERALAGIRRMIDPNASVLRNGLRGTIPTDQVVPGDVVVLEAGDRIPADLRLLRASNFQVEEAALTGEAVAVEKNIAPNDPHVSLGDRTAMAFAAPRWPQAQRVGSLWRQAPPPSLARISDLVAKVKRLPTQLVRQMDQFARQLTIGVALRAAVAFAATYWVRDYGVADSFMIVVGLAVATIPEGLPAVLIGVAAVVLGRLALTYAASSMSPSAPNPCRYLKVLSWPASG